MARQRRLRLLDWRSALLAALVVSVPAHVALASPIAPESKTSAPASRDETFYQIFLRSFYDSNGDRIGDLRGVETKLDYLQHRGVTSVLLTPLQPSPFYHNYFASSFEGIDPAYGRMADFRSLVRALHRRGMKTDLAADPATVTFSANDIAAAGLSGSWVDLLRDRASVNPRELQLAPYDVRLLGTP